MSHNEPSRVSAACLQTCVLALLSAVLLEIAAADGQPQPSRIALSIGIQTVLLALGHAGCRRWVRREAARPRTAQANLRVGAERSPQSAHPPAEILIPVLIGLALLPPGIDLLSRHHFNTGSAFELTLLGGMRNVVLGLAAMSVWPTYLKVATGASVLLAIFTSSVGNDRAVIVLLGLYAVVGMWWLMGLYWRRLQDHLHATSERSLPRRWLIVIPSLALALTVAIATQSPRTTTAVLAGIAPTSGGTQWYDEFARGGIGDGDAFVSGTQDASTFGPVESDLFLESDETSLYDAFSDTYGEPLTKSKNSRAIALPPNLVKETEQRMAQAKQANREFSTVRQVTPQQRELEDISSPSLLAVTGRGPLHLRLQTYDLFDGEDWYPTEMTTSSAVLIKMVERENKPWIALEDWASTNDVYDAGEHHVLKLLNLKTDRLPLPTNCVAFHIDRVDRPDLFAWAQDGVVRLQSEEGVPPQTVLHAFSRVMDESKIRMLRDSEIMSRSDRLAPLPIDEGTVALGRVAAAWAGHLPRDWSRVETVVAKLRSEFLHERGADGWDRHPACRVGGDDVEVKRQLAQPAGLASIPTNKLPTIHDDRQSGSLSHVESRVAKFVLTERRGPDYLFASAACLMLRQLGFTTRLVSGFYVDPQKYDLKRRHIPVTKDDVHFWCEVYVSARTWVPIEPTPGYELLAPPPGLWARCWLAVKSVAAWSLTHAGLLSAGLLLLIALWWWRCALLDVLIRASWSWRSMTPRERVLAAHRLLEKRAVWAGSPKPGWMSARRWYVTSLPHEEDVSSRDSPRLDLLRDGSTNSDCELLRLWAGFVDWACFAPESVAVAEDIGPLCRLVLNRWSIGRLMAFRRDSRNESKLSA